MTAAEPSPPESAWPRWLSLADLKAVSVLGRSAKGVVFHVVPGEDRGGGGDTMALKAISRETTRHKKAGSGGEDGHRRIWFERDVILALRHPLLPSLRGVLATDAISMGTKGMCYMSYSLQSRELIANSIETVMGMQHCDVNISIPGCDKNMQGTIMAMGWLNRPSIVVYGGIIKRARESFFKDFDAQQMSLPDSSNTDGLREFIKVVYVERRCFHAGIS